MVESFRTWLVSGGCPEALAAAVSWIGVLALILVLSWIANLVAKRLIIRIVHYLIARTETTKDDIFLRRKAFNKLSHLAPALVIYAMAEPRGITERRLKVNRRCLDS